MKILAVSDAPSKMLEAQFDAAYWRDVGIELILSCGDLSTEYLNYLGDAFRVPLFYVRGNHDATWETPPCGDNIDGKIVKMDGKRILGLEGSATYNGGDAQYSERRMALRIALLKPRLWLGGPLDVVATHSAPRFCPNAYRLCTKPAGVGMRCPYLIDDATGAPRVCVDASDYPHRGFECFREFILEHKPRIFIHGHRHRTFGIGKRELRIGETRVIDTYGHVVLDI
jgi:hypothetical protein